MPILSTARYAEASEADRLDAEFFDPEDIALIARLKQEGGKPLGVVCDVLNGRTPADYS